MERSQLRAGDADRQQVADRLRRALDEGRLTLDEYDERLHRAYSAKTFGDLDRLVADLPGPPVTPAVPPAVEGPGRRTPMRRRWAVPCYGIMWGTLLAVALVNIAIWAMASLAAGHPVDFWPIWVFGPWGIFLFFWGRAWSPGGRTRRESGHDRWP